MNNYYFIREQNYAYYSNSFPKTKKLREIIPSAFFLL